MPEQRPVIQFNHAKADYNSRAYQERNERREAELADLRRYATVDRERMKVRAKR